MIGHKTNTDDTDQICVIRVICGQLPYDVDRD